MTKIIFIEDTLLNVFLAIAVDNLANAQELTAQQEEAERMAVEQKKKSLAHEKIMFIPIVENSMEATSRNMDTPNQSQVNMPSKTASQPQQQQQMRNSTINFADITTPVSISSSCRISNNNLKKPSLYANDFNGDVDTILNRKVDIDYIPGLDDDTDLKVILPGKFFHKLFHISDPIK